MSTTEIDLVRASVAIGKIAELPHLATAEMAARIDLTGRSVAELTVAELVKVVNDHEDYINRASEVMNG